MAVLSWLRNFTTSSVRTYARELGWASKPSPPGTVHTGYYRAVGLRWQGHVYQTSKALDFYILKPPVDLIRDTDFGGCFHARNDGWWLVAFRPEAIPPDLDSGVAAIQYVLAKAFQVRAAKRRRQ